MWYCCTRPRATFTADGASKSSSPGSEKGPTGVRDLRSIALVCSGYPHIDHKATVQTLPKGFREANLVAAGRLAFSLSQLAWAIRADIQKAILRSSRHCCALAAAVFGTG